MTDIFHTFGDAQAYCLSFISQKPRERTLRRITELMRLLGNPQKKLHVIHVTGSYGKSTTAYMIASLLEQKGLKVGLHIKPHLQSMTERMSINRVPIPDNLFVRYVNAIKPVVEAMEAPPTYFDLLVAVMLWYFKKQHVDVAVIEAGRGGKLDATNICAGDMLVITNIFLVHTDILGNSKENILKEKMGLARTHTAIVAGISQKPLQKLVRSLAKPIHASVQFSDTACVGNISVPMHGTIYKHNAALAVSAATAYTQLTDKQISDAFRLMKLPGRFEVQHINTNTVIMDSAHNREKMRMLLADLQREYPNKKMTVLLRQKNAEELRAFTRLLKPLTKSVIPVSLEGKHAQGMTADEAVFRIRQSKNALFLVTGSMQLIGRIRAGLSIPYRLK
jgi:dihydrofolate synthase/folylpolyglutamate synthase